MQNQTLSTAFAFLIATVAVAAPLHSKAQPAPESVCATPHDSRCEAWRSVVAEPDSYPLTFTSSTSSLSLSADGGTAFVSGYARDQENPFDSKSVGMVAAIDVATGEQRWLTTISPTPYVTLSAITTADDGTVLVTGKVSKGFLSGDTGILVAALDPVHGELLWREIINPSPSTDVALDIASGISQGGNQEQVVVITGWTRSQDPSGDGYTLAFTTDGRLKWIARYDAGRKDISWNVEIANGLAIVAVQSLGDQSPYDTDIVTVAYALNDGSLVWENRFSGSGAGAQDAPRALTVSPDGDTVVVAGYSNATRQGPPFAVDFDAIVIAYDTDSGIELWRHRWRASDYFLTWSSETSFPVPRDIVATKERVIFTAAVRNVFEEGLDMATVALDLNTGRFAWVAIESALGADFELPNALAASPDSETVVVIGHRSWSDTRYLYAGQAENGAQVVLAYAADNGDALWKAQLRYSQVDDDSGKDLAITSDGTVVTTAQLIRNVQLERDFYDIGVAAYR